ncbi:CRAL-TRIO domain-containing protein [Syncephalastrum racemosum]|uniref:CRAL-TRIO domain-containing protein n=1 Tax=Syncephalastrum racemosum TaxID=13706 RepID=A0A1X2HSX9_SYNRA|nr:CRAL-TRIO domain-containing protein [Syncephalastrum racemosum]
MLTEPPPISLENRKPGHAGRLTADETAALKKLWLRVFDLFQQAGQPWELSTNEKAPKSTGRFWPLVGGNEKKSNELVFVGRTSNPRWMSLPLKDAIPLIPGDSLARTFWNMVATDNPDSAMLRYLRARKWDFEAAYWMLADTLRWRLYMRIDDITALGEVGLQDHLNQIRAGMGEQFMAQMRSGKATLGGPDKDSRGVAFLNVRLHHKEDQPHEVIQIVGLYLVETARLFCGHPMDTACIVFNLEKFTLANMDLELLKFMITSLQNYYPETLGLILIHKAPWIFSTVWHMIVPLLDPVVASKIQFTQSLSDFTKFIDISGVPVIISGDPNRKTKDEASTASPIMTTLDRTSKAYAAYEEEKVAYTEETLAWAKQPVEEDLERDALRRLARGRAYRLKRIQAEKDLRSPTSYHAKGIIHLTDENRLLIDFGTSFKQQDITDRV